MPAVFLYVYMVRQQRCRSWLQGGRAFHFMQFPESAAAIREGLSELETQGEERMDDV
jgi:hypothetical protein